MLPSRWLDAKKLAVLVLLLAAGPVSAADRDGSSTRPEDKARAGRWESAIAAFEAQDRKEPPPKDAILFVGSSSIRMWKLPESFPDLPVMNRGFGGSQIADVVAYADRIVIPYRPKAIVFYSGDNDIASGKSPEEVAADFQTLVQKIRSALPETRLVAISTKPSLSRWKLVDKIRQANALMRAAAEKTPNVVFVDVQPPMLGPDGKPRAELFLRDGLHLNAEGYKLWASLVLPHLK